MRSVFLDSVGLIALWSKRDQWHAAAAAAHAALLAQNAAMVTTEAILFESGNALARTPHRHAVVVLKQHLEDSGDLIVPSADEGSRAWRAYAEGEAGNAGIVGHIFFEVVRRLGIREAFTNDQHFEAAGFTALF